MALTGTPAAAASALRAGRLVILPTETVYGLAADAGDARAVAAVYAAKGRPAFNPLIAHVASVEAAREVAVFSPDAEILKAGYPAAFGVFGAHRFHHTTLDDARSLDPALVERLLPRFQAAMLKALGEA